MKRYSAFWITILMLALSALACNLPFMTSQPQATAAPTDAGFLAPTEPGAPVVDPGQTPQPVTPGAEAEATPAAPPSGGGPGGDKRLTLASTDSLAKAGLLNALVNRFMDATGYEVVLEVGGTGRAFRLGEKFVADALLVNNPGNEKTFITDGFGRDRALVFHSDFVIVGPANDPAGIKGAASAVDAFKKIAGSGSKFVTRATDAPEILREKRLWGEAGITPSGDWYITATDAGPVAVLKLASDKKAYALIDRATFLQHKPTLALEIVFEGDPALFDIYHILSVNPDKSPKINYPAVQAFIQFLNSPEVQQLIAQYGVETYGQPIFFPDAGKADY